MFHGKRMRSYEHIIVEEVMREIATWPEDRDFETLPSMTSITLGAILRAVFGAEGPALDELRDLLPPMVLLASLILTVARRMRRDLGPWSPGGGICGTGAVSTLSSTRSSPMRGPIPPWQSVATCLRCWCRPATKTGSRSRIGTSPTRCWP